MALEYNKISGVATIFSYELKSISADREVGTIRIKEDNSFLKEGVRDMSRNMFIDIKFFQDPNKRRFDKTREYLQKGERIHYEGVLKDNNWEKDGVKHNTKYIDASKLIPFSMMPRLVPNVATQENSAPIDVPAAVGYDEEAW